MPKNSIFIQLLKQYIALVKNNKIIEQCLKLKLKKNQVIKIKNHL